MGVHLSSSWTTGKWKLNNDTIILQSEIVYDTLKYSSTPNSPSIQKLVISIDETSEVVSLDQHLASSRISRSQNTYQPPEKLYFHNNRLYIITLNGKIIKKKQKGIFGRKKSPSYYIRKM